MARHGLSKNGQARDCLLVSGRQRRSGDPDGTITADSYDGPSATPSASHRLDRADFNGRTFVYALIPVVANRSDLSPSCVYNARRRGDRPGKRIRLERPGPPNRGGRTVSNKKMEADRFTTSA